MKRGGIGRRRREGREEGRTRGGEDGVEMKREEREGREGGRKNGGREALGLLFGTNGIQSKQK